MRTGYSELGKSFGRACHLIKIHNLKVQNYILFGGLTEDLEGNLSHSSQELLQSSNGGARTHNSFS